MRVLILHDLSPGEARFGVRRRADHLRWYEEAAGHEVEVRSVVPVSRTDPDRLARLVLALVTGRRSTVAGFDKVVVVALWAPNMVLLARTLTRRTGTPVQLDLCDSRRLLTAARPEPRNRSERLRAAASDAVARVAFARLPSTIPRSYISQKDADADAGLSPSETVVIGPAPVAELTGVSSFVGRPASVLCPIDGTSVEGRAALSTLLEMLAEAEVRVPIEATGERPADAPGGSAVLWLGRVPTLVELYSRPCVVVSTNRLGHGVQNKLWEAFQARRPIVAFDEALHWAPERSWIHRVASETQFGSVLRAALETHHDTGSVPEGSTSHTDVEPEGAVRGMSRPAPPLPSSA